LKNETACIPKEWNHVETDKALFYANFANSNENTYFAITAYSQDVQLQNYLKEMAKVLSSDTIEQTQSYKLTELVFPKKTAYYTEVYSKKDTTNYCFYMMLWKVNGTTYDFGLKTKLSEKDKYYKFFQTILYNFQSNGEQIFSEKDQLEKIKHLKFEDL
jgi:hypothetical protein